MAAIIAGRFEQQDRAKKATDELSRQRSSRRASHYVLQQSSRAACCVSDR